MHVYFMSICGTGMGNAALLLRELGHRISGADENTYPPMSDRLAEAGVEVMTGYDARRLNQLNPDLVVVGNVNTRGNPEIEWLLDERKIPFVSLPEVLSDLVLKPRRNIVISGTHGKTTTTSLTAWLLTNNGFDPGYLVGGVPRDLPTGARVGDLKDPFVIEGDEYDSAFFDKRSKFIHYLPHILVLNNLEFDHADIYRDLKDVQRSFQHLLKIVPRSGYVLANGDDHNVRDLLNFNWTPVIRVGAGENCDLRIVDFKESPDGSSFKLLWKGKLWAQVQWKLWSLYNARNVAMAALAAGLVANPDDPTVISLDSLVDFKGVKKRQEVIFENAGCVLINDFAHHPSAIRQTLESLRQRYQGKRISLCFEARSNTACRNVLEAEFEAAFGTADHIHLGAVYRADRYADADRIDLPAIASRLGPRAHAYHSNAELAEGLIASLLEDPEQVVCFFSNGSFDGIPAQVATALSTTGQS